MLLFENFRKEGELDYISEDPETVSLSVRNFDTLWESDHVISDKAKVIGLLEDFVRTLI